jgi:hypothetical protein
VILLAVGWYLRFSLSYRDVKEFLAERACTAITSRCGYAIAVGVADQIETTTEPGRIQKRFCWSA